MSNPNFQKTLTPEKFDRISSKCLYTFIESEVRKWQVHKAEKVTKIKSRIISKPHAHLQTMGKTCAKFQKDWYKIVWEVALTWYPLSQNLRSENDKVPKVKKVTKINTRITSKPHAYLQTMEKTCTKFQKDRYKIAWGVALTRYPLSIHWGRKMAHKVPTVYTLRSKNGSQGTHCLYIVVEKWLSSQSGKSDKK